MREQLSQLPDATYTPLTLADNDENDGNSHSNKGAASSRAE